MTTSHAQENQLVVMEESCTPLTAASSCILVDDKYNVSPRAILECHICMDSSTDPVATSCGHVFCWPCLSQWFQNATNTCPLKPCPICRKLLSTDVNILSLHHGAGDGAARSGSSHGEDSAGEAAAAGNVVPPRPSNPVFFVPWESGSTPQSGASNFMAISRAIHQLDRERSRGRSLVLERARRKQRQKQLKKDLRRRNSDLTQETNRMSEHIAQLERLLALANQQLPSGWNDDTV